MATYKNYPIDLPILVIEAQIFVAVKKFSFLPNKQIPNVWPAAGGALPHPRHGEGVHGEALAVPGPHPAGHPA